MSWSHRREHVVTHGRDGFHLSIEDRWRPTVLADKTTDVVMAALGHPCCGTGLGRIPGTDLFWFRLLNLSCKIRRHRDRTIMTFPLTPEQAFTLRPDMRDDSFFASVAVDGLDEHGYTWEGGRMVGVPERD